MNKRLRRMRHRDVRHHQWAQQQPVSGGIPTIKGNAQMDQLCEVLDHGPMPAAGNGHPLQVRVS